MVKKIKKKIKKGPKGSYAVPMCMALTCLYGIRLEGKDFRRSLEAPEKVRNVLMDHLGQRVLVGDRVLSQFEYIDWGLKSTPSRLAHQFSQSEFIPLESPTGHDEEGRPVLGILPILVLLKGKEVEAFLRKAVGEFSEVNRVAFQNSVASVFNLIPGYDQLLYSPPCHPRQLDDALSTLNDMMDDSFYKAGVPSPGPFEPFPEEFLTRIPLSEPF